MDRVFLTVHAWFHPASLNDSVILSTMEALRHIGIKADILRPYYLPYNRVSQAFFPLIARSLMSYRHHEGILHDLYGDSVFRGVSVATIHDFYWNSKQSGFVPKAVQIQQLLYQSYKRTLKLAKRVVVDTPFIFNEIAKLYGRELTEKVRVVPIPCGPRVQLQDSQIKYDILWIGTTAKRKRFFDFLKIIPMLPKDVRIAIKLNPVSGAISDNLALIYSLLDKYKAEGRMIDIFLEKLHFGQIEELYQSSRCLISTSSYEGFHMPVAEAYLRGVHVLLPDIEVYRSQFQNEVGIHWYRNFEDVPAIVRDSLNYTRFVPDRGLVDYLSYENAGMLLKEIYEEVQSN